MYEEFDYPGWTLHPITTHFFLDFEGLETFVPGEVEFAKFNYTY